MYSFPCSSVVKNPSATQETWRQGFNPWVGKLPWRRKWKPTSEFLTGQSHGKRRLVGYCPWGGKELDMMEQLSTYTESIYIYIHTHMYIYIHRNIYGNRGERER